MSFIQYTKPKIDFSKEIRTALYSVYHTTFTEEDIAYRYRLVPNKHKLKPISIIKRKVLFNEYTKFIYDPVSNRNTFLSGSCNKEGEVKNNIVWYREDNDLRAMNDFLKYFKNRVDNNFYYDILDEVIITTLEEQIKSRICNHTDEDGNLTITYNSVSNECRCWKCGARFIEAQEDI